ncbi:MAG: zinc-ribbon domain-containing protein [Thermodesulfobacteriota bacterium]
MFCQRCHVEYDESRKYCRNCGSPLSANQKPSLGEAAYFPLAERRRIVRVCPFCRLQFEVGNYCRICGSNLKYEDISPDGDPAQERRLVKSLSSEWFRLMKTKNELEICFRNLVEQRNALSDDTFNLTFQRNQVQLESLSCRLEEMEAGLEAIRRSVSRKIGLLEEEHGTLQKRLNEIRSLRQSRAITFADYSSERHDIIRRMRSKMKRLKEFREIVSQLPGPLGRGAVSPIITRNLIRYQSSAIIGAILIMMAAGAYFLWAKNPQSSHSEGPPQTSQTKPSTQALLPLSPPEAREDKNIRSLLETIRRANLEKNIDLFMSCYASDFNGRNKKKSATLETWSHFDYRSLSYDFKTLSLTAQTARVRVKWQTQISPKRGGPSEKTTTVLDVSLKKEAGHWKIKKIEPVI